ncbi:MAG TPA: DUF2199 domain-containing protein [Dokdonella sp.]|nr:DUF2199 domain-containing protein [Dokdonella sp.]
MDATRAFFDIVDRLDVPRHQPRRVEAALRGELQRMSAAQLEDFQHGFDLALADVRMPQLWAAAGLVHEPLDPHDYDGFAAWLLLQGEHVARRALTDPDAVIAALTRRLFGRRRRPLYHDVLEAAQRIYEERFGRDLYAIVAAPAWRLDPLYEHAPDASVLWTHPEILEQRYPELTRAFDTRALRVIPMSDDCSDVCTCCGRVYRVGYGLLAHKRAPLGAYTVHFVEGAFGAVDSTVTLDTGERSVMVGVRHSQLGSCSGVRVLEEDEMPWHPGDDRVVLGRDAARAHPLHRRALQAMLGVWEREPRLAAHRSAWRRRQSLAEASARHVAAPAAPADRACASCGRVHGDLEISHRLPDALATMSRWQWRHRVRGDGDDLLLDGRRRFQRGLLPVAVDGAREPYRFGVWIERLDPSLGTRAIDGREEAQRRLQRGARGLLANDLLFLPESTLGLEVSIRQRADGERPEFRLDADLDHPLATMQRDGVAADLPRRLLALVPHD